MLRRLRANIFTHTTPDLKKFQVRFSSFSFRAVVSAIQSRVLLIFRLFHSMRCQGDIRLWPQRPNLSAFVPRKSICQLSLRRENAEFHRHSWFQLTRELQRFLQSDVLSSMKIARKYEITIDTQKIRGTVNFENFVRKSLKLRISISNCSEIADKNQITAENVTNILV